MTPGPESGDVERTFVAVDSPTGHVNGAGFHPCQGVWHRAASRAPTVGVIATHYAVDFSEHYLAGPLAQRGVGFLGWNTRFRNNESWFALDHALVDIGAGVRWLHEEAGVDTVVLLGNCGGGSLMAAYQAQATEPTPAPGPVGALADALGTLAAGDLYVSLQAHPGRPEVLTRWLDPSVTDEGDPVSTDASLDMFDPDHGPPYSDDFVVRYRRAQEERNHRITDWASAELARLTEAGTYDRNFNVHRTWADLRFMDPAIDPSGRPAGRCLGGDPRWCNRSPFSIASNSSLRTWLDMWSLRHSRCRGEPNLGRISVPALVVQSTGDVGVFPSDARSIHDALDSEDKTLEWIEGDHYLETPAPARAEVADRVAEWIADRR